MHQSTAYPTMLFPLRESTRTSISRPGRSTRSKNVSRLPRAGERLRFDRHDRHRRPPRSSRRTRALRVARLAESIVAPRSTLARTWAPTAAGCGTVSVVVGRKGAWTRRRASRQMERTATSNYGEARPLDRRCCAVSAPSPTKIAHRAVSSPASASRSVTPVGSEPFRVHSRAHRPRSTHHTRDSPRASKRT